MRLISLKCPGCGAALQVDESGGKAVCDHCDTSFLVDNEIQRIQYDNAEAAGYQFEKGRQRAKAESE